MIRLLARMTSMHPDHEAQRSPVEIFMKSWRVYQEIIVNNYMFHREITEAASTELTHLKPGQSLRILDLGAGDASMTLPLLPAERIASYIGCDLSQPALDLASHKLVTSDIPHQLVCDDMLKVAAEQSVDSFDLVISSYAMHHLNAQQKQQMIQEISRILAADGCFLLIDVFREMSEDRAAYMRHYMETLRRTWANLSPASQELVVDHATNYDFPEQTDFYSALCLKHGLGSGKQLAKHTWHEAWLFTTSPKNQSA